MSVKQLSDWGEWTQDEIREYQLTRLRELEPIYTNAGLTPSQPQERMNYLFDWLGYTEEQRQRFTEYVEKQAEETGDRVWGLQILEMTVIKSAGL